MKTGVPTLKSKRLQIKEKQGYRGHCIMTEGSIHQDDKIILNVYRPKKSFKLYF